MRVLITGATGFVGQHLVRLLMTRKQEIYGTYLVRNDIYFSGKVELFSCDLRKRDRVLEIVRQLRPARVYHLAGLSSVKDSLEAPQAVYQTNFTGTLNLLEAIRDAAPRARVLLITSAQCYGRVAPKHLPISESQILLPENPYSASKAAADLLGYQFFCSYGLHIIRARPFNHTGPGQSAEFVCSSFARQIAEIELGLKPPVLTVGNLNSVRDFSDVRDVVRAYELLLRKSAPGEAYNICSSRIISLSDTIEILRSFTRQPVKVVVEPARVRNRDVEKLYGSNRKLREATGWRSLYTFETTLRDLYLDWKEKLQTLKGHTDNLPRKA